MNEKRASALATVGLLGIVFNAAALVVTPLLRPDIDPLRSGLSHYALGPWGSLQTAAFIALGIGALALAAAIWLVSGPSVCLRIGAVMLGLASFSLAGLAIFPMGARGPMTPVGDLHLTAGTAAVSWQVLSVVAVLFGLRTWRQEQWLLRLGVVLLAISLLGAAAVQIAIWRPDLGIPEGLAMRVVLAPLLGWWACIAVAIRRRPAG